jgi:hypothetical protein
MRVGDPGHVYQLDTLDGSDPQYLTFVKREGPGYPGNVGHWPGTNLQEVLRVCIDRVKYLDGQIPHMTNALVLAHLRSAIQWLESRAAQRHGRDQPQFTQQVELMPVCPKCGHVECNEMEDSKCPTISPQRPRPRTENS